MQRYIIRRCLFALLILALFSLLAFFMVRLLPGDPIRAAMQQNVDLTDESIVQEVRAQYGLDKPVPVQYYIWLRDFFKADWGTSLGSGDAVWDMFWRRLPVTLELFFGATFWAFLIGFPLGIYSALRRNSFLDILFTTLAIIAVSAPAFWVAIILIYGFAVKLQIFPPSGFVPFFENPKENILCVAMPTFVMGVGSAGLLARYVRSSFLEILSQDFIRTAWAKGLDERAIVVKHAAKPAMIPVVTVIGLAWGFMVAGTFIIEFMFAIPGIGRMGYDAIFARDFPVIQAVLIATAVNVLLANLVVDILYGYLDPRVRLQ
jgi:peptide/nickel transport system permease protein